MVRPIVENAIGIDLGTTNCCVGFMQNGVVKIIPNLVTDERTTPSYVFFQNTETHVGKLAMNNVPVSPEKVVYDAKRMIGRSYHDENIQKNLHYWKFRVEEGPSSKPLIRIPKGNGREIYTPEEISSIILRQLKSQAEKFTGKTVKNAVVTVPAYFNYHQRTATQKAAEDAGLNVLQIINEPTAAALAYVDVNYRNQSCDKKILIYDLGGGTFDVSILHVKKNDVDESFKVLATSGDTYLGGRDFDNNLTDLILQKLRQKEITINNKLTRRVSALASKTKIDLTEAEQTNVVLPFIDNDEDEDFFITVTRSEFNSINEHLFQRTIDIVDKSLEDAGLNDSRVDEIVLVGGSSKIPKIRNLIETRFPRIPVTESVSSSEAVAYGATIRAVTFEAGSNRALSIQDVTPLSLGTDIIGDRMSFVIGRNSTIPVEIRTRRYTVKDNQTSMHFTIYEGERLFVKDNTKLGSFVVDLPPKPIGRPVDVIFSLDENGVLTVGAEVDSKIYKNLSILYEPSNPVKASSLVEEANLSKSVDNAALKRATRMVNLKLYVRKISALCDRKSRLTESQKKILRDIANDTLRWVELYDGCQCDVTEQIDLKVRDKEEEVDRIVEPILKKYRYEVKNVCIGDFYEFLMTLN